MGQIIGLYKCWSSSTLTKIVWFQNIDSEIMKWKHHNNELKISWINNENEFLILKYIAVHTLRVLFHATNQFTICTFAKLSTSHKSNGQSTSY